MHLARSCHGYLTFPEGTNNPIALKVISHSRQNSPRVLAVRMNVSRNRRKTPIVGHTTCGSEREDKKLWHQRWRTR